MAFKKLRQYGCRIISTMNTPCGGVIHIEKPTAEMQVHATRIQQQYRGVHSVIYTIRFDNFTVKWNGGEYGGELCR
ncbi:hypothetical protein [Vibrio quintilis]|nr:hypothetical protein [Vibrio quintilis]